MLENVFMEVHLYNPPPLSLSRVPVAQHKHHESQHQTLHSLWGAQTRWNQASWFIVDYHKTHCICCSRLSLQHARSFFADLSIYGLGSKVALFTAPCMGRGCGYTRLGCGREALSRHLCFLHLLAGFAVRLTTTHPFESIK